MMCECLVYADDGYGESMFLCELAELVLAGDDAAVDMADDIVAPIPL